MKRRMRIRVRRSVAEGYWRLDAWPGDGRASADVICPHSHPVDLLRADNGEQVTWADLDKWVNDHADEFLENWCRYGH